MVNVRPKVILRLFFWNLAAAAAVFLPLFIAAREAILATAGFPFAPGGLAWEVGNVVVLYLALALPVAVGTLVHSLSLLLVACSGAGHLRLGTLALSPLLVLVPAFTMGMGTFFFEFLIDAAIATLGYGLIAAVQWPRSAAPLQRHRGDASTS